MPVDLHPGAPTEMAEFAEEVANAQAEAAKGSKGGGPNSQRGKGIASSSMSSAPSHEPPTSYLTKGSPDAKTCVVIPRFNRPTASVKSFAKQFPLPDELFKIWKKGVTFPTVSEKCVHSKRIPDDYIDLALVKALEESHVIESAEDSIWTTYYFTCFIFKK
jgi:hypothetical protein